MIRRRIWIYKKLIRCYLRTPAAWIQERRRDRLTVAALEGLTDPGLLDRIK